MEKQELNSVLFTLVDGLQLDDDVMISASDFAEKILGFE